ncbi:MAG: hydrolase [Deltaproteobacteria bacterium]|nr:hydrolase [Deltaproteobacteria bacterium]
MPVLEPPQYLIRLRNHLRERESGRWQWFASDGFAAEQADAVRLSLLQSSYRMEPAAHPGLYAAAQRAQEALGLNLPVTFYQAHEGVGMNAGLCFIPGEAHVVLSGPILSTLTDLELTALVGHELAHAVLWRLDEGSLRVASELIESIASHHGAEPSFVSTAVRARRYTEIFADRGSLLACGDPLAVVSCLVKVHTGLSEVDPAAYVRQAEELFAKKSLSSQGTSHPETFVRARAISLWHALGADAEPTIAKMVQGPTTFDALDVLDQLALTEQTRALIARIVAPSWFRTEPVMAHARAFFPRLEPVEQAQPAWPEGTADASVGEYFAYVLLDFALVDEVLGDVALAHAWTTADALALTESFEKVARDELKLRKTAFEELRKGFPALLERAAQQGDTP